MTDIQPKLQVIHVPGFRQIAFLTLKLLIYIFIRQGALTLWSISNLYLTQPNLKKAPVEKKLSPLLFFIKNSRL